ncbi:GvpL/GvpF family gas vesicle protein [Streptomyces sp. ICBB 8177]|uniref:GvpL/GvpF family gas vesicle protein n=1 Tax=Streptomyces sp. ICBB 8177 TaxID=563922 RepID=UPI000D67DF1C|nr:GvpL/GvpF family gas vesicle protein [Streptomyces sp. ICBB 8177]PWI42934.1 gas vesicle protein [Streptomyces sp. ICBB 8177]
MSIYVYAIVDTDHPLRLDGLKGVGEPGGALRTVEAGNLRAVVSDAPAQLRAKRRDLAAHQGVLERLLEDGAVLPMRFGLVGADDEQVVSVLEANATAYAERLGEVDGRVEYNLKVSRDEDDMLREIVEDSQDVRRLNELTRANPTAQDQKVALGELLAKEVRAREEQEAKDVVDRLSGAADRHAVADPVESAFLNVSFLVKREDAPAFSRAVTEEANRRGDAYTFRLRGPLPPYSFV